MLVCRFLFYTVASTLLNTDVFTMRLHPASQMLWSIQKSGSQRAGNSVSIHWSKEELKSC